MKEKQILVIVKKPGGDAYIEPLFDNTLEAFQRAVGGYVEALSFATDACVICNEEGRIMDLPYNCSFLGHDFVGPILIVGIKGDEFRSLRGTLVARMLRELNK